MNLLLHCATQRYNRCNVTNICDITNCPSQHQQQHHAVTWLPGASTLYITSSVQYTLKMEWQVVRRSDTSEDFLLDMCIYQLTSMLLLAGVAQKYQLLKIFIQIVKLSKPHSFEMLLTGLLCGVVWIIENIRTKPRYICKKLSPVPAFPAQSSSDCRKYLIETSCKQNLHIFSKAIGGRAAQKLLFRNVS